MSRKLSPEAAHEKYLYNKKYQDGYWERKAAKRNGNVEVKVSISEDLLPELETVTVTVSRNGHSDERYIKALEQANRTLNSENRRLIRLLSKYQEIIKIGLNQLEYENNQRNR